MPPRSPRNTLPDNSIVDSLALNSFEIGSEVSERNVGKTEETEANHIVIRSNKMQQYAGIYLLQNHSTYFGCPSHPSSGVHKTVTAASGTGHSI